MNVTAARSSAGTLPYVPLALTIAGFNVPQNLLLWFVVLLILWVVAYILYRIAMTKRKDFGMPVRRRIFCRDLRVERDEVADVPFWWNDIQVQRAVSTYWRYSLRSPFLPPPEY